MTHSNCLRRIITPIWKTTLSFCVLIYVAVIFNLDVTVASWFGWFNWFDLRRCKYSVWNEWRITLLRHSLGWMVNELSYGLHTFCKYLRRSTESVGLWRKWKVCFWQLPLISIVKKVASHMLSRFWKGALLLHCWIEMKWQKNSRILTSDACKVLPIDIVCTLCSAEGYQNIPE